tara:strand:- start:134 stop:901 length:768 start_codon:yes stop_codon:yes gene_type:complete
MTHTAALRFTTKPAQLVFLMLAMVACFIAPAQAEETYHLQLADVKQLITEQLIDKGAGEQIELDVSGRTQPVLFRSSKPLEAALDMVDFDARSMTWNANMSLYDGDKVAKVLELSGRYAPQIEIPVLKRRLHSSEMIAEDDIEWVGYPEHRLRKDTVLDAKTLIGKSPRRVISEHRPIRADDIEEPKVVDKGDLVRVAYQTPYMEIRTVGEALEEAALGQRIRIRNSESGIVIQAVVTGTGSAEVKELLQISDAR